MTLEKLADSLSVREVSALLRKDPSAVLRYVHGGQLEAFRTGGTWRIPRAALESFVNSQTKAALRSAAPLSVRAESTSAPIPAHVERELDAYGFGK